MFNSSTIDIWSIILELKERILGIGPREIHKFKEITNSRIIFDENMSFLWFKF